jgi:hypothetical protein
MAASNIMSEFRATGIYPFDPHVIPEEAFAPSAVSEATEERQPATSVIRNQNTAELNKRSRTPRDSLSDSSDTKDDDPSFSSLLVTTPPKAQSPATQKTPSQLKIVPSRMVTPQCLIKQKPLQLHFLPFSPHPNENALRGSHVKH